jgi:hypothetical protein
MAGVDESQRPGVDLEDREQHGGHEVGAQRGVVAVHALDQRDRPVALQRVGARDRAQLAHPRGGVDAVARDIPDDDAEAAAGQRDRVVPVAADPRPARAGRDVRGERDADDARQPVGQQRALQRRGDPAVALVGHLHQQLLRGAVHVAHGDDADRHRARGAVGAGDVRRPRLAAVAVRRRRIQPLDQRRPVALVQHVVDRRARQQRGRTPGEPLQRRVDLQREAVEVAERHPGRRGGEGVAHQLVAAAQLAAVAVEVGEDLHLGPQHQRVEGLEQVVDGARLVAGEDLGQVALGRGQEDDRDVARPLTGLDQLGGLDAVHARHLDVEQDHREVADEHLAQRLLAGVGLDDVDAQRLQDGLQRDAVLAPVVDEQDPCGVDLHHQRCSQTRMSDSSCSTSTGLVT